MNQKTLQIVLYCFAAFFLSYVVLRAIYAGITHDESFTWYYYIKGNFLDILHNNPPNANNHILNSFLAKGFSMFFGYSPFVLRLPSILAYCLYLFVAIKFSKRFQNPALVISGFVLLNANPYLLDFFALSRGYGLAHAFMLCGVYFVLRLIETGNTKYSWFAMISSALAVVSISTMMYFFAATVVALNILYINKSGAIKNISKLTSWLRMNIPVFIVSAIMIALIFEHARKLLAFKQLYIGGTAGFYDNTILSLVMGSLYNQQYFHNQYNVVGAIMISVVAICLIVSFVKYGVKRKVDVNCIVVLLFLLSPVFFSLLHRYAFNGAYLVSRTTLFFYPLFIIVLTCFLYSMHKWIKGWVSGVLTVSLALVVLFHVIRVMNLDYTPEWKYDASTLQMLEDVHADLRPTAEQEPIKIGIHWTFEPAINFYRETRHLTWLKAADHEGFDLPAAYYYIYESDSAYLYKNNLRIIRRYPVSGTLLAKPIVRH